MPPGTPRRSTRIIEKAKAAALVEHQSEPPKKQRVEGSEVVQTKDEEKVGKPAKEMKKRWWNRDWKLGQSSK
ncbi:hypothetical protein MTR_6g052040 [Medicago truncatula]|uniref:Uncharacterized protein n=1 Tax=Medicago truncatula TaxID=3880 RepID=G7KL38_MEDTR|nr:hypothetical protein MTR_6g052040 [Medicago truncatula]